MRDTAVSGKYNAYEELASAILQQAISDFKHNIIDNSTHTNREQITRDLSNNPLWDYFMPKPFTDYIDILTKKR